MQTPKFLFPLTLFSLLAIYSAGRALVAQDTSTRIGSIIFDGNQSMGTAQLKLLLRNSQEGNEYSPGNLQADLRQLEMTYRDAGFLKMHLEMPDVQVQTAGDKKTAVIRIIIREGPRYSTGKLAVKDAEALAPETLMQICPLQRNQPYSPIKASQWQAKVEDAYRSMGYLRARCPVRENISEFGKTVDCTMECVEGKVYTVGKISLTGDKPVNAADFKKRLLFSEGGIFNPEMLMLSMQFLNQSHLYEPIMSSDVEIRIDDDRGVVDVLLHVVSLAH